MKSTVKERLIAFINYLGMSKNAFENACGLSTRYVSNISASVSPDKLKQISLKFPELNIEWLLTGQGDMLREKLSTSTISGDITIGDVRNSNLSHIGHGQRNISGNNNCNLPVLVEMCEDGTEVIQCPECGTVIEVAETALMPLIPQEVMQKPDVDLGQYIKKNPEKLSMINLAEFFPGATKAVEVDTRAMEPEYKKGHFLVIEKLPDLSYARADGTAYVVDAMRPHSLLRYLTRERDGSYVLTAESDKKRPIYLRADEINGVWKIVGGFWRE
jgi:hypothetical protein